MRDVGSLQSELALLAATFVLPGLGPDVDQAIKIACDLLVHELDTPATVEVAALRYGTPLREAEPLIREMLREQGFPAADPDAGEADEFRTVLRALAAGSLQVGEFFGLFMRRVPVWEEQDELQRHLVVLLSDWAEESTPEGRSAVAAVLRAVAWEAVSRAL